MLLTIKQQQFCKYYIENKGNATKAYMKAFGTKKYNTAKVEASKLLTNPNIKGEIQEIMDENGFNDISVDLELMQIIQQNKNLYAKLRAIEIYNKIKNRYSEDYREKPIYLEKDFKDMTDEELMSLIRK